MFLLMLVPLKPSHPHSCPLHCSTSLVDESSDGKYIVTVLSIFIGPAIIWQWSLFSGSELMRLREVRTSNPAMSFVSIKVLCWHSPWSGCKMAYKPISQTEAVPYLRLKAGISLLLCTLRNQKLWICFVSHQTGVHVSWVLTLCVGVASRLGCSTAFVATANQLT